MKGNQTILVVLLTLLGAPATALTLTANVTLTASQLNPGGPASCVLASAGASSAGASMSDADLVGNPPICGGSVFSPIGSYSLSGSAGASAWTLGVTAAVAGSEDADGNLDGLEALSSATFSDTMTVTVASLAAGDPLQIVFDYEFDGTCSSSGGYGCPATYQIRVFSTSVVQINTATGGVFHGQTTPRDVFNGFEFTVGGSLFTRAASSGQTGSATGSFGNTGRLVGFHVLQGGVEIDPSGYSVITGSGVLPVPEPGTATLLLLPALLGARRFCAGARGSGTRQTPA